MSVYEELVERCARKSFAFWAKNKGSQYVFEDMHPSERDFSLALARDQVAEVLRTLKAVTPEMQKVGEETEIGHSWRPGGEYTYSPEDIWGAMLDASPATPDA